MKHHATLTACASLLAAGMLAAAVPSVSADPAKYPTHDAAAQQLRQAGITWSSSGRCSDRNRSTCTSFTQINKATIAGVIAFKKASRCAVTITGGTEKGHSPGTYSHWNGYKVDISPNQCADNYITGNFRYAGRRVGDNAKMYKSPAGNVYAREGSHWDILYYNGNR
jgi:hypothetical protein